MSEMKKVKATKSCYTCSHLGWRHYMTGPHSGGTDYSCKKTGKEINSPRDAICDDWGKRQKDGSK